ncbi:MAG: response regulator transcription factor [Acetobacteraceae bacterium]
MKADAILVVDDEPQIHRFLAPVLEAAGYAVLHATNGTEALRLAAARSPILVLLDLGLPDIDGQEVLRRFRAFSPAPVIILSARDRPIEKIAALDGGANDYVEKPFDVGELLARIRAALRSSLGHDRAEDFRNGALHVDFVRRLVRVDGSAVALSPREYELLELLAKNAGRVLTHPQILTAVWGPAHVNDQPYVRVYIGHLRQKLGPTAGGFLVTEPGVGYRLLTDGH